MSSIKKWLLYSLIFNSVYEIENTELDWASLIIFMLGFSILNLYPIACRSQWPRGLRRGSAVSRAAGIVGSNTTVCLL